MSIAYTQGLHELGNSLYAYLQPDGGWGWSNAGLVCDGDQSLLIDTLFDLPLTERMLSEMRRAAPAAARIDTLINTHANGDHCYGNELVPDRATIYATVAAAEEMKEAPASRLDGLKSAPDPAIAEFANYAFGDFDFTEVTGRAPDTTFEHELTLSVGGRPVMIRDLGPAHTQSDSIVHVPSARTVFTGDLVFVEGTPIAWAGPISNWITACDTICGLDVETVVPGHGPVTDKQGVLDVKRYFEFVFAEARQRQRAGMDAMEAAFDIDLGEFAELSDSERIVVTVETAYRDVDPSRPVADPAVMFRGMGAYHKQKVS